MSVIFSLLCLIATTAVVSLFFGALFRSRPIAIIGSFVIVEMLLLLLIYRAIASSSDAPEVIGFPRVAAIFSAPIIFLTSYGSVMIANRLKRSRTST